MLPYSVRGSRSVKQESRGWEGCFFCVSWYNRWREKHTRIDQEAKYSAELRLANIHGCSRACVSPMTADGQLVALGHSDPDLNANGRDHQELFRVWGRKGFLGLYTSPIHGHTHSWRVIVFFFFLGIIPDFYFFLSRFFFVIFSIQWFFYSFCPPTSFLVVTFFHDVFFLKCSLCDSSYFPFLRGFRFSQAKHASKKVNEFLKRKPDLLMTFSSFLFRCVIFARAEYDMYKSLCVFF